MQYVFVLWCPPALQLSRAVGADGAGALRGADPGHGDVGQRHGLEEDLLHLLPGQAAQGLQGRPHLRLHVLSHHPASGHSHRGCYNLTVKMHCSGLNRKVTL